ncbi:MULTISPECIES: acyl carrier protein [Ruminococcus]|uniref:Acyl carrier protein n=1 Tax=Ruminococcus champanellensis (strain DSM 18848 / JCM 17042 / KCTC 15320 / 18P13) TaxID=213810 RepID=D4LFE7_RUMC1|nr:MULTISPECIES: acyl carrier protein [Ruminococcus]MED9891829.1 acyl carrier protein [Ruminococcus champanellensis]CBL18342.1 acyl carrier protein [Ruminococcus champanellensis 18P13 = JCM 17042]CDD52943.1 acyl carrier protein [Ruminococcus sp. CAG:379]
MTFDKLKAIIVEQFDVDEALVTPEADMQEDLGIDSLDVVDLIVIISEEFDIEIPDEAVDNIKTVGDIVAYIDSQQAE